MKNNKQEMAVEWLLNAIETKNGEEFSSYYTEFIEQAKEMEKQQAIRLHYEYELYVMMNESVVMTFGQFYEQTYGGNK